MPKYIVLFFLLSACFFCSCTSTRSAKSKLFFPAEELEIAQSEKHFLQPANIEKEDFQEDSIAVNVTKNTAVPESKIALKKAEKVTENAKFASAPKSVVVTKGIEVLGKIILERRKSASVLYSASKGDYSLAKVAFIIALVSAALCFTSVGLLGLLGALIALILGIIGLFSSDKLLSALNILISLGIIVLFVLRLLLVLILVNGMVTFFAGIR